MAEAGTSYLDAAPCELPKPCGANCSVTVIAKTGSCCPVVEVGAQAEPGWGAPRVSRLVSRSVLH